MLIYLGSIKLRASRIGESTDIKDGATLKKDDFKYVLESLDGQIVGILGKDDSGYFVDISLDKALKHRVVGIHDYEVPEKNDCSDFVVLVNKGESK